jgi:ABC-type sugar transport system ATPase subunit
MLRPDPSISGKSKKQDLTPYPALTKIRGRVELTESLRVEAILNVRINGERIVAKLDRRSQARAGDEIDLDFDMSGIRIFDRKTGDRIEC